MIGAEERTRCCGGIYFLVALPFWRSLSSNWAGVICCIIGGDRGIDEGLGDKGVEGDSEGDGGDNR
jgi:hypothetical protein